MHLSVDSEKPISSLRRDLLGAVEEQGLEVAAVSDAASHLTASGVAGRASFVVELADPLPELRVDPASGRSAKTTYKIAGYERQGGGTRLSTMRPTELVGLLGHPELAEPASRLERRLQGVLRRAAGVDPADPG